MTSKILSPLLTAIVTIVFCSALQIGPGASQEKHGGHGSHGASGMHGEGHDVMHHWYKTLKQPMTGMSCCDDTDCRPTTSRVVGEAVEVMVDGEWTAVPKEKIVKTPSPDLGSHVCAPKYGNAKPKTLFCVVIGGGV